MPLLAAGAILLIPFTMRISFQLVHSWEVIWERVRWLSHLLSTVCEPAVATELAAATYPTVTT
jgi:hypothetical protein